MMPVRSLVALCLALAIALGAVASGAARGKAPTMAVITICSEAGAVSLPVDAEGRPVDRCHHCPDCLLQGSAVPAAGPALPARPMCGRALVRCRAADNATGRIAVARRARGPPARS